MNTRNFKASEFSKTIEAISIAIIDWSKVNAPSVKLSKGRLKSKSPQEIKIEFRASVDNTHGTFVLAGPPRDFLSVDFLPYYMDKLIDIYARELGRLLTKNEYVLNYKRVCDYDFRKRGLEYVPEQRQNHCRFCNKGEPDVTFQHKAHAVAQMFGNAALVTKSECDDCNDYFGRTIEKQLGVFSLTARLFSRTEGQRGIPSRHDDKRQWTIDVIDDVMQIKTLEGLDIFTVSEDSKTVTAVIPGQEVIPIAVLKAMLKFAISIMSDADFKQYQDVAFWVREPDHTKQLAGFNPLMITSFFEQVHPPGGISLLKRASSNLEYPRMTFILVFGNHHYQCFLPSLAESHGSKSKAMAHALISDFKPKSVVARNLSATEPILMAPATVTLSSESEVLKEAAPSLPKGS